MDRSPPAEICFHSLHLCPCNTGHFVSFSCTLFMIFLSSFVFIFALPQKLIDKEKVSDQVTVSGIP